MIDYIACLLVRILNKVMAFVPVSVSLWLGRRIGTVAFIFNRKRRCVAYANLKAAFAREKPPQELRAITKRVYQNLVQTFMEILNLTKVNRRYVDRYVEVVNIERIRNAAKSGRGTILLTGHFGDWELSSLVSSIIGFPIMVLAREQKMKRLNELLNRLRESNGCKVVRKGISTKNILRALREKNIVGILSDQDAGRNGTFVDFFGRPTSCHIGPMEMARHTGSIILPNFIVRTKGPYHKLFLEEYIEGGDIKKNLQKFANVLEAYVRKYPDQWLWLHKRWKSTPVRTILVLDDGKAGHLNQSLAVAAGIQKARMAGGHKPEDTRVVVAKVRFKNAFSRAFLSVAAGLSSWRCHGCMRCMRFCLEGASYETLMKTYSDFVVSCGSSLAAANVFMSIENNAKNIIVMKPGPVVGLDKFSLAFIPRHDNPPKAKNVVATAIAPNLVDEAAMRADADRLKKRLGGISGETIGVFVGGDNPEFALTEDIINKVIDSLAGFCGKYGAEFLVTTSRRTSPQVEKALKDRLKDDPRARLLVIANENNFDEAVGGILGLSKVAVVSEESVSMISEAVSSGKRVVVFSLAKKRAAPAKHERTLNMLADEGYISVSAPEELAAAVEKAWDSASPAKEFKDREKILEAVRRLI